MEKEVFVPLPELIERPRKELTPLQVKLVEAHEKANAKWEEFRLKKLPIEISVPPEILLVPELTQSTKEEKAALNSGFLLLQKIVEYYHHHDEIPRAYATLKEFAEQHYHPAVSEFWPHYFKKAADKKKTVLPPTLNVLINEDADKNIRKRERRGTESIKLPNTPETQKLIKKLRDTLKRRFRKKTN